MVVVIGLPVKESPMATNWLGASPPVVPFSWGHFVLMMAFDMGGPVNKWPAFGLAWCGEHS